MLIITATRRDYVVNDVTVIDANGQESPRHVVDVLHRWPFMLRAPEVNSLFK